MSWYQTKRRLLRPVTAIRRRHRSPKVDPFTRAVYEAHDYRPSMRRFFLASAQQPDLLIDVDLPAAAVVLDVGAFTGEWSGRLLECADARGPADLRIHAFEPVGVSVRELEQALADEPRVEIHPFGLAGRDRVESMAVDGPGSSVFPAAGAPGALGTVEVPLRDVDAVLRSLDIERIALVKVNIEGGEYELFDRLHEMGWLARCGPVIVQFHEFAPHAHRARRRTRTQLAQTHRCTWGYPWVYERWDPR